MEIDTMFLDWKNQYYQNDYTTQDNYRFSRIFIKLPMVFFTELEPKNLKMFMKTHQPWIAKAVFRKKNGVGGSKLPDVRLHCKATEWCGPKHKNRAHLNRRESPAVNPGTCGQFVAKEARIYIGGNTISSINAAGKTGQLHVKKIRTFLNTVNKNKMD